jgi:trehalose 6-phosphate phosphatase
MSSRLTAMEALAAEPGRSGLVLDFDGVLSPIIEDPTASALPDRAAAALRRLSGRLGLLAVISGRPVAFLEDRIRIPGVPLLGSYGIERSDNGVRRLDPAAVRWTSQVGEAGRTLRELLEDSPGLRVEEKTVSVAVHWRQAPDYAAAAEEVRRVTARLADETGLRLEPGKLVEELRPPVDVDKGSALSALLEATPNLTALAYAGDDLGDAPALRKARAWGGYALVVDHGPETDPLLRALADETYPGTEAFADWLGRLADATGAR